MKRHKKVKKTTKKSKTSGYKKGSLKEAIFNLFDHRGLDKVTFEQALAVAKKTKPGTPYNAQHHAWYRNKYRNEKDV